MIDTPFSSLPNKRMALKHLSPLLLLLVTLTIATCQGLEPGILHQINLLRPHQGSAGNPHLGLSCLSWRLAVETNNIINWTVPEECGSYVGHYMLGQQYRLDSAVVIDQAVNYSRSFNLTGVRKPAWVFDIDETSLSNLPYYAHHGFGTKPYNNTTFQKWVSKGEALALPETLRLYHELLALKIKIVFLTARKEDKINVTTANLRKAGFRTWEKLILQAESDDVPKSLLYKSRERTKLAKEGYLIVGNIGDQWSDILGPDHGIRTFKLPDPMYYIA